jgi:magnesium transporter
MLTAMALDDGRLDVREDADPGGSIWIDLVDPTEEERARVQALYGQELPEPEDVEELEASARMYEDQAGLYLNSFFLNRLESRPRIESVAFRIRGERLFTLHEHEIPAFRLLRMRSRRTPGLARDPLSIVVSLFEIKVEELADTLEGVYSDLETLGRQVLESGRADLEQAIGTLARHEDLNGKVRLCLMDAQRTLAFLLRCNRLDAAQAERVRAVQRDVESLLPHNAFVFERVNFLMDAAQGFINIEQNQIIKIFSIAAVVFLPPTLVASIYGMNFEFMPELGWRWGYPFSILLMLIAGVVPFWYFKRKGWLAPSARTGHRRRWPAPGRDRKRPPGAR